MKLWGRIVGLSLICMSLSACFSNIMTGASIVYDTHQWYRKLDDFQLTANVKQVLFDEPSIKCDTCSVEYTIFNHDILLVGHVPSQAVRRKVSERMRALHNKRHLYNELVVTRERGDVFTDTWITTKIRSQMLTDASINPKQFKVVTFDGVVYLMGDVMPEQAEIVVMYARQWSEVRRVVKLFQYYHLSSHAASEQNPSSD